MTNDRPLSLKILNSRIDTCRICSRHVPGYQKPAPLERGNLCKVMIVGQGPGNTEIVSGKAFSGQAGTRLDQWLIASGALETDPRREVYLTSVVKCVTSAQTPPKSMIHDCIGFLHDQIALLKPGLVISLGKVAYQALRVFEQDYETALCTIADTRNVYLVPPFGYHYRLLAWPHPSGLNRWHNVPENKTKLASTFPLVGTQVGSAQ